jgi:hypothetical protein
MIEIVLKQVVYVGISVGLKIRNSERLMNLEVKSNKGHEYFIEKLPYKVLCTLRRS